MKELNQNSDLEFHFSPKKIKAVFFKQNLYHTKRIKLRLFCYTINKTRQDKARFNE